MWPFSSVVVMNSYLLLTLGFSVIETEAFSIPLPKVGVNG